MSEPCDPLVPRIAVREISDRSRKVSSRRHSGPIHQYRNHLHLVTQSRLEFQPDVIRWLLQMPFAAHLCCEPAAADQRDDHARRADRCIDDLSEVLAGLNRRTVAEYSIYPESTGERSVQVRGCRVSVAAVITDEDACLRSKFADR